MTKVLPRYCRELKENLIKVIEEKQLKPVAVIKRNISEAAIIYR